MLLEDGNIGIKLHNTIVVIIEPDDSFTLQSGGWQTPTTKDRMNNFMPGGHLGIHQEKSIWYFTSGGGRVAYADGMRIDRSGGITGEGEDPQAKLKLDRKARKYCKRYIEKFMAGEIPKPGMGDCLICQIDQPTTVPGSDHILSHIEEEYYVPRLLYNAITHERAMMSWAAKEFVNNIWAETPTQHSRYIDWARDIVSNQVRKALLRYIRMHLGLAC
jgi:hypothetical protein